MSATAPTDYYALLGVTADASADDIKRAYRRLAREHHPDANPDDAGAEARFKEIAVAYETLSDPERRRRYDMFGPEGAAGGPGQGPFGGAGGLGDIFDMFFGGGGGGFGGPSGPSGPPRGVDLEATVRVAFADAVFGTEEPVTVRTAVGCDTCEGSGCAPGTYPSRCEECGGAGQVRRVRQSLLGQMVTASPCPRCAGMGEWIEHRCDDCGGEGRQVVERTYTIDVPAGIDDGQTLRLTGRGAIGPRGGAAGDLYVHIRVEPHERFERRGLDLHCDLPVAMVQAALGAELALELLDGTEQITVAPGTQSGTEVRLRGRGVPRVDGRGRGDVRVRLVVETPTKPSKDEEALLRQLAELQGHPVAAPGSKLFTKLRSAFS